MTDQTNIATLAEIGPSPFFLFCDHASNRIPEELNGLGLPEDLLQTHIAWDIGSAALGDALAQRLGATILKCGFSRLVVDANRAVTSHDVIPATSDQIPIPGNQMLHEEDRRRRIDDYHEAYHLRLGVALDAFAARRAAPFVVSIHSYTKRLMGAAEDRPWPVGMLWDSDEASARAMIDYLSRETDWPVGDNEPYDAREFNYSVDRHVTPRGIPHLTFEVRQDFICDADGVDRMADMLAPGVRKVAAHSEARAS